MHQAARLNDSDSDSDKYSSDPQIKEDVPKPGNSDEDDYEDSPRVKSDDRKGEEDDYLNEESLEVDEDEMIDVAEKIFVRIADEIIKHKLTVRMVLQQHIFPAEIDGDSYELLAPEGLIEGIRDLGIEDLKEIEI